MRLIVELQNKALLKRNFLQNTMDGVFRPFGYPFKPAYEFSSL